MASRVCLVHYHEVGLKGKNRAHFEHILIDTIKAACAAFSVATCARISGHILVTFSEPGDAEQAFPIIRRVPGVARVSLAFHTNRDPKEYCRAAIRALGEVGEFESFKVAAKRSNTDYPLGSLELNAQVGEALCIDSPVATWLIARRGAVCVPVHFSGRPQTADTSEYLCQDIIRAFAPAIQIGRLYVVPFGEAQRQIALACPTSLRVIMYRRVMYAVAERIARLEGAKAIVTGESLGQVASQTLENIAAVNEMVTLPVLRPLIGSDKQEIIERAHEIGTYDISCETAPDCCTLFMPRRPETHAKLDAVHEAWDMFDHDAMIDRLVENVEYVDFHSPCYRVPKALSVHHDDLMPAH